MSNSWSMEDIISGTDKPKAPAKKDEETPKSTLQLLAAAKTKENDATPLTPVTGLTPVSNVTPLTPVRGVSNEIEEIPVAPTKNFQKVSNSIVKQAIPQGVFKSGKSKELYDVLYSLTRGAFTPSRTVRISKPKLQKLAGIGAPQTLNQGLMHLQIVGLVKINPVEGGKHVGHEYEVYLYEETFASTGVTPLTPVTPLTNLPPLPPLQTDSGKGGLNAENKDSSENVKTSSLKTLRYIDDEAPIFDVLEKLNGAARKVTGKDLTKKDLEKLSDVFEVLITETVIAAARAGSVSAFIPFLAENLRRRLYLKPGPTGKKETRPKHLDVGKGAKDKSSEEVSWAPQPQTPLSKEQRENTLRALREAKEANTIFFPEFKAYGEIEYTPEDFSWLIENLEKGGGE